MNNTDTILKMAERKCMDAYAQSWIDSRFVEMVAKLTDVQATSDLIMVAYE